MGHDRFDEASLRTAVHDAYGTIVASPQPRELAERVRRGVARAQVRRMTTAVAGGLVFVAATASLGLAFPRDHGTAQASAPPLTCPASPFPATAGNGGTGSAAQREGLENSLVPGTPTSALACAFRTTRGANGQSTSTLLSSHRLAGAQFAAVLSAVHEPVARGAAYCPFAPTTDELTLVFGYGSGPTVTVEISMRGCPGVTNGVLYGIFAPAGHVPPALSALDP